ncbi:hypothetical protein JCM10207_007040 [Rhodosporidiobolus poonsookiae]
MPATSRAGSMAPSLTCAGEQHTPAAAPTPSPASTTTLTCDEPPDAVDTEHVDVKKAERDFEHLRRELSRHSSHFRAQTGQRDPEKEGDDAASEDFDLLSYLEGEVRESDAAGRKRKALGCAWRGLRVVGGGGNRVYIPTFVDACRDWVMWAPNKVMQLAGISSDSPRNLLHEFDGCLKPGEMCLVLGRPGSGCTTFLKTIANNRGGYLAVEGDVSYGGISAVEMAKRYRGEVVYNQEDDIHAATLTVAQTLLFALRLKTPGELLPEQTRKGLQQEVLDVLVKMLGISHTKDTKVGSAYVRGVSGGERKRVSIAEMMATRAIVCSWDNSTRGLDASTALDYAKALRVLTDVHQMATFVSLYQAGEGIYNQFDKVLVIDEGRQVYFGPAKEARQYMMDLGYADLPRQTTADYLTGCTDPNERKLAPGRTESNVPSTPSALESSFKQSDIASRMLVERDAYLSRVDEDEKAQQDFREAVRTGKGKGSRVKSPYTASFPAQVWALMIRQWQLKAQDQVDIAVQYGSTIVIALIIGSVFFQLPTSSAGAFERGGGIFLGIVFTGFQAFNELPSQMGGRPLVWKHRTFALYRPGAVTLAAALADLPSNMLLLFIFSVILYFMMGLYSSAGAFFSYYIIATATYLASAAYFRFFGTVMANYDEANRWVCWVVTFFEVLSGYLKPIQDQPRFIFWISYINPFAYGQAGLMINEFKRLQLTCDGSYIFPNSLDGQLPQYPEVLSEFQVCTLAGSSGGSRIISGLDYIRATYSYELSDQWRNFGILLAMYIGVSAVQAYCAELVNDGDTASRINVFARENQDRKRLNAALEQNKEAYRKGEAEQNLSKLVDTSKALTWENLTYTVPVPGGQRQLLDNVFGFVKPGQLTALMGSSGAGKTTLLDVLADRKTIGVIGGDRLIAGRPPGGDFQRGTAYVEQQDVHEQTSTVREAFRFSAYLRQPASVPKEEKDAYVEEVIQLLELEDYADAMLGMPGYGLDVEARKRVTIGVELASKPQLMLFLDEPTSGLDGQSAYNVVRFLRKLAAAGLPVLCTIHQPNAMLFENFDRLLLLQRGGRTAFFGDIGKDSHVLRDYLARNGAVCPDDANPAEFMLEAIGAGSRKKIGDKDWADIYLDSPEFAENKRIIEELKQEGLAMPDADEKKLEREYATPILYQLTEVSKRSLVAFYRSPDYGFTRLFNHITLSLIMALVYLQLSNSLNEMQYRVFALFYLVAIPAILAAQVAPMFQHNRSTFVREGSSKMYSPTVFGLSQLIAEIPYSILCSAVFFLIFYYPIGFNYDSDRAGYAFIFIFLLEVYSVTMGQMAAALTPTEYAAEMSMPFLLIIFTLFCGVTVKPNDLVGFWRRFMYPLNPFTYFVEGMMVNEMEGLEVQCTSSEYRVFDPPSGQSCLDWAGPYIEAAAGYLANPNATVDCQYCEYANGVEYADSYGWSFSHRWRNFGVFLCYCAFNMGVVVCGAKYLTSRFNKR